MKTGRGIGVAGYCLILKVLAYPVTIIILFGYYVLMEIMTRSEAKSKLLATYFTGAPCRNNHLTFRYTNNGCCSACVKAANDQIRNPGAIAVPNFREISSNLIQFKVRLFDNDLDFFRMILFNAARMHEPAIRMRDLWGKDTGSNRDSGTALYRFSCFAADVQGLRDTAQKLFDARCMGAVPVRSPVADIARRLDAEYDREYEKSLPPDGK